MKKLLLTALFIIFSSAYFSCTPERKAPTEGGEPGSGSLGSFDAARYVAIGNSITAGFLSNSLYEAGQLNSYPALIARQAHGRSENGLGQSKFQMPIIAEPGFGAAVTVGNNTVLASGRIELGGFSSTGTPITVVNTSPTGNGQPPPNNPAFRNATLARPYNNLGIPGIVMGDATQAITASNSLSRSPFIDIILRNPLLGNRSPVQQAAALLAPQQGDKLVTFWLGNNDVLGYATSGGVSPAAPTPTAAFTAFYVRALNSLRRIPNVKIIVANIPDVTAIPFMTTLGPLFRTLLTVNRIPAIFYQRGGTVPGNPAVGVPTQLPTSDVGNPARALILLTGSAAIQQVGATNGVFARQYWAGILANANPAILSLPPAQQDTIIRQTLGIVTTAPFALSPQNPLPNQYILDDGEITIARNAIQEFNNAIRAQVGQSGVVGLVDINGIFNNIVRNGGIEVDGEWLKTDLAIGGLFSMDGVHPSPKAHGIVANEFIRIINREFNASIPLVIVRNLSNGIVQAGTQATASGEAIDFTKPEHIKYLDAKLYEEVARQCGAFREKLRISY
ncbi:MAG: SGNH/GDSL hydrolase family protein [Chloroherpetonaceae bacterium]|nr:SGNH/GDSL hydrolase family protein [Chloroherpetonaceae bacterium]